MRKTNAQFVKEAILIHKNKYDYSQVDYKNAHEKIKIICPIHGEFLHPPHSHLRGEGCQECGITQISKGELKIIDFLNNKDIVFNRQKTFPGCKYIQLLQFDFYLPFYNVCVEFDGIQHFKPISLFGGETMLLQTQLRDTIKNKYCEDNNIPLLRIKYNENIENKLNAFLKKLF